MKVEVIVKEPIPPPKEYAIRINQEEMDLITSLLGRTSGGPAWVLPLYESFKQHAGPLAEEIIVNYVSIKLKNDKT